jgi:outer membrane immunogenic protein
MKRVLLGIAGTVALFSASSANAAPPTTPVYSWTGWYAGVHAGAMSVGDANVSGTPVFGNAGVLGAVLAGQITAANFNNSFDQSPVFMGGGQLGYNWCVSPMFLVGVEADLSYVSRKEGFASAVTPIPGFASITANSNTIVGHAFDYFGTVRGRVGYLWGDTLLIYGTGGLAYGQTAADVAANTTLANSSGPGTFGTFIPGQSIRPGYVVGGGFEYALSRNYSAKLEALYYDLGSRTDSGVITTTNFNSTVFYQTGVSRTQDFSGAIVRFGLNYQFN